MSIFLFEMGVSLCSLCWTGLCKPVWPQTLRGMHYQTGLVAWQFLILTLNLDILLNKLEYLFLAIYFPIVTYKSFFKVISDF